MQLSAHPDHVLRSLLFENFALQYLVVEMAGWSGERQVLRLIEHLLEVELGEIVPELRGFLLHFWAGTLHRLCLERLRVVFEVLSGFDLSGFSSVDPGVNSLDFLLSVDLHI